MLNIVFRCFFFCFWLKWLFTFDLFSVVHFSLRSGWKLQVFGLLRVASRPSTIPYRLGVMSTVSLQWQSSGGKRMHQENGLFAAHKNSTPARPDKWLPPWQSQGSHSRTQEHYTCRAINNVQTAIDKFISQVEERNTEIIVEGESSSNHSLDHNLL